MANGASATAASRRLIPQRYRQPAGSEGKLHGELENPRVYRADDLAERRRAEDESKSGRARLQAGRRKPGVHAVGHVEGLRGELQHSRLLDMKIAGKGGVPLPEAGTGNIHAAQRAERAGWRGGESLRVDPATRRGSGVRTQRIFQDWQRPLYTGRIRVQRHVGGENRRDPIGRRGSENLRELPVRGKKAEPPVGKLGNLVDDRGVEDVAPVRGKGSTDFVRLAIAAIEAPVVGNRQAVSRIARAVADRKIADAVGP